MPEMEHVPDDRQSFSNLEVASGEQESWKYKAPEYSGPIALDTHIFPEAVPGQGPEILSSRDPASYSTAVDTDKEVMSSPGKRRRLIILGVIVGIIVIVGAVAGGILGSRHSKNASTPPQDPANNEDPQPGEEVAQQKILSNSSLSAVNWTSGDDGGVHYRAVFWQADTHDLMASIWESDTHKWSNVNLTQGGTMDVSNAYNKQFIPAKPGTPLAATVRLHEWPKFAAIVLFYLSEQNTVEQMGTGVLTAKTGWNICCLSQMSNKHTAAEDSQLAAFTVACKGSQCTTDWIHVAYQRAGGQVATLTQADWSKQSDITGSDAQIGTGLTMTSTGSQSSNDSKVFTPKLFLQTSNELQQKLWYPYSGSRTRIEGSRTGSDGSPVQLSSAVIPASGDAASTSNDLLLVSIADDGSQLLINQYSDQTGNWTGSSIPELTKAPSNTNFTAGAVVASPDEPRFFALESNGTIQSFKISQKNATQWEYEGVVLPS